MEDKCKCIICRHYGQEKDDSDQYERSSIYSESGRELVINLCKVHDIELFKIGQRKFLTSHYKILAEVVDSNDTTFLEILEETVKKNINSIY